MDFTLKKYEQLIKIIRENGILIYTIKEWIKTPGEKGIIIRHDVDRLPGNALQMARLETRYNIRTTYYFRILKHTFKPDIIKAIAEMGHEVGYHYEDLSLAKGNYSKAIVLFEKHLKQLREIVPVVTIAMHGRPLSEYDNRMLWKKTDYKQFGLLGEAFLSIDYTDIFYFTDTGRSWSENASNLRDKVKTNKHVKVSKTQHLETFIKNNPTEEMAFVIHPERWNNNITTWIFYFILDTAFIIIKKSLIFIHKIKRPR